MDTRRILEIGGVVAGVVMIAFGIGSLALGINARQTVGDELKREFIVGSEDVNPADTEEAVAEAGLGRAWTSRRATWRRRRSRTEATPVASPGTCASARFESSGGNAYAQMGRYVSAAKPGRPEGAPATRRRPRRTRTASRSRTPPATRR